MPKSAQTYLIAMQSKIIALQEELKVEKQKYFCFESDIEELKSRVEALESPAGK